MGEEFFIFRDEAIRLLGDAISKIVELREKYSEEKLFDIYSDIHTVKGEVGFFGFSDVAEVLHLAEDELMKLKKFIEERENSEKSNREIDIFDFNSQISDSVESILRKLIFASSRLRAASSDEIKSVDGFSEYVGTFFQEYSSALGKRAKLNFEINVRSVSAEFFSVVLHIVVALVRNSLEHGIESPDVRLGAGKPAEGAVDICIDELEDGHFSIAYRDDGAGFLPSIIDKIKREGFVAIRGLSTKPVSLYSGRGVGLYSIYRRVAELGGSISIDSQITKGATIKINFRIFEKGEKARG